MYTPENDPNKETYHPRKVLAEMNKGFENKEVAQLLAEKHGIELRGVTTEVVDVKDFRAFFTVEEGKEDEIVAALNAEPTVKTAERELQYKLMS